MSENEEKLTPKEKWEERQKTLEERKQYAIKNGRRYEYIVCPLCLRARSSKTWKGETNFKIDPNPEIVQVRYGVGGRGKGGFYRNEEEGIKIGKLKAERPKLYENLRTEVIKLYGLFEGG